MVSGRSPSGQATRSSTRARSGLGHTASVLNAVSFTDAELDLIRHAVGVQQRDCARAFAGENDTGAKLFYGSRLDELNAIIAKLEARLMADASQDAEEVEE